MEISTTADNSTSNGNDGQFTGQFFQDCLAALGGAKEDAAMVLNDRGEVLFCNSKGATIFNSPPDRLTGKHLSDFVLNMRLNVWTPGSNVAYAAYTGRRNQWREYCALDPSGRGLPVELLLDVLVVNLRYLILLWARAPAQRAAFQGPAIASKMPDRRSLNRDGAIAA